MRQTVSYRSEAGEPAAASTIPAPSLFFTFGQWKGIATMTCIETALPQQHPSDS